MLLNPQAKKRTAVLVKVIDPSFKGEIKPLFHHGSKEEYVEDTGDPFKYLLVIPIIYVRKHPKIKYLKN